MSSAAPGNSPVAVPLDAAAVAASSPTSARVRALALGARAAAGDGGSTNHTHPVPMLGCADPGMAPRIEGLLEALRHHCDPLAVVELHEGAAGLLRLARVADEEGRKVARGWPSRRVVSRTRTNRPPAALRLRPMLPPVCHGEMTNRRWSCASERIPIPLPMLHLPDCAPMLMASLLGEAVNCTEFLTLPSAGTGGLALEAHHPV